MLWRSSMLLVCWPLLLPPGFCVCRLEAFAPRPVGRSDEVVAKDRADPPRPKCRCCRHAGDEPSPAKSAACRPDSPSPDRPHAPGCPACPTWDVSRISLPAAEGLDHCGVLALDPTASWLDLGESPSILPVRAGDLLPASHHFCGNLRC